MNNPDCKNTGQNTNSVYGKLAALKITNVLYSNKYCCICLETCDGLLGLDTCSAVDGGEQNLMILSLKEMLEAIFDDTILHILRDSSNHLCPACTDSIQKTLSFIQKTKTHALIFARYFNTLHRLSTNLLQLGHTENLTTVVLNASLDTLPKDFKRDEEQSAGEKRKREDASPQVRKKTKVIDGIEIQKQIETEVDVEIVERESSEVVGVITEGNELIGNDTASSDNNDKDNQQLSHISEPTEPDANECCPVCEKRPCIHENYLAAFEKRQKNRIIVCPECSELLYTLNALIKHVNMDHFKSKPTIRDVCNKIFQRDLVKKEKATKNQIHPHSKSQGSENSDHFVGEVVNEEPPIGAEITLQEAEHNYEAMEHNEENSQTHIEKRNHCDDQSDVATSDLISKRTKILRLKQGLEEDVLNPAVSSILNTCTTETIFHDHTNSNIELSPTDTEQIIQKSEIHASNEQAKEKSVIEHTGLHIGSEPLHHDNRKNLVEIDLLEKGTTTCLKSDVVTDKIDVQKKVLTGILKKGNTPSKKRKSVKFGDCPTLSAWRQASISANLNEEAKINVETKTTQEAKENEKSLINKEQDVDKKLKDVAVISSKSSLSPLDKSSVNKPNQREFSIVLVDVFKDRKLARSQPQITVYDDRYKKLMSFSNDKVVASKQIKPVNSAENIVVNKNTNVHESGIHKGPRVTEKGLTLQTDVPKSNQETSLTRTEKLISGIFESTKVSTKKVTTRNKGIHITDVRVTDSLQKSNVINQTPEIPKNIQKEVTGTSNAKIVNAEPQKCMQHETVNVPPNINNMNTQHLINEPTNKALKTVQIICNDIHKENLVTDLSKENTVNSQPSQSVNCLQYPTVDVTPNKDFMNTEKVVHKQTNVDLKTAQIIVGNLKGEPICKVNTETSTVKPNVGKVLDVKRKSPSSKIDFTSKLGLIQTQTSIELKTNQEIGNTTEQPAILEEGEIKTVRPNIETKSNFERISLPYKKVSVNTYKVIRELKKGEIITVNNEKEFNVERKSFASPNKVAPSNIQNLIQEQTTELKLAQELVGATKGESAYIEEGEIITVRPNNDKVLNLERKLLAFPNKKPPSDTQITIHEQRNTALTDAQGLVETAKEQSTCVEGVIIDATPSNDIVFNVYGKVLDSPNNKDPIIKQSLICEKTDTESTLRQELLRIPKQSVCSGDVITVRPNNEKGFNLEKNLTPNKKHSKNTYNVIRKLEKGEVITVKSNNEQVLNLDRQPLESPNKENPNTSDVIREQTNKELKTAQNKVENKKIQKRVYNTSKSKHDKVIHIGNKLLVRSGSNKKIRRELGKKPIISNLRKKNETLHGLSQKAAQSVYKQQKEVEKSDESTVEKELPLSISEVIEEASIIEQNEKYALTYEKQRRGRTFECPACKKMMNSLKYLIAHVNKNDCKQNTNQPKSKESQGVSLKDVKRLNPVVKILKLASKSEISKRTGTSSETDEKKLIRAEICPKCNVLDCKHHRYRQAYEKLRKNKITKCPECKHMLYSLSGFIAHVNKNHTESKIVLRDIYLKDFPSTFVLSDNKCEKLENSPNKNVSGNKEMKINTKCTENDDLETETPMDGYEVEFLEDMDEIEECEESREESIETKKDETTADIPREPMQCHKCQFNCSDQETYTQHRQEHELLEALYKEETAEQVLEDEMENTVNKITEANKRSHKCESCGVVCKSRTQLTLHLKSSGHVLMGTTSCPQCVKRPCRHEKYLCAYEKQKTVKIECYECKKTQPSLDALITHVNNEHLSIQSVKCDGCNQMVRGNLFKKHNKKCQKQQMPVKCAKCPSVLFVNEEAYMVHNLEHELLELNEVSGKTEVTKITLEPEISEIIDEGKIYECGTCGKIFRHRSWLKLHLKATNHVVKRDLSCPHCSKRPCKHEDYLLTFENQNDKNKLKCEQCKDSLDSLSNYIAHINKDHLKNKPFKCDCCKVEFYLKSQLITHLKVHEPKLTCEHCYCEFRRSLFRKHKIKCQNVRKCAKCPALFPNEKAYTIHEQEHPEHLENTQTTSVKKSSVTEDQIISRKKCNKTKYDCPICQFHCSRREKLSTHLNSMHRMESRRTCSVCVTVFATRQKYLDHREDKFKKCSIYEKMERQKRYDPREKRACNICKRMVARESMAVHLRTHSQDCPYPCHGCSMIFKRSSERALHVLKVHSGR